MKARNLYVTIFAMGLWMMISCEKVGSEVDASVALGQQALVKVNFRVNPEQLSGESKASFESVLNREGDDVVDDGPRSRSIVNAGTDTDEGTTAGYVPRDVWVIQYDGTGDDAPLSGLPRYVELSGSTNIQAVASTTENTLVFVANTHDATLEWGDIGTLGKMKRASREIKSEKDCYGSNYSSAKDLIFSGKYEGVINNSTISVDIFRNIARLDFTLKNGPASGMILQTIQLCNVPKDFYYAASLVQKDVLFPTMINYFDYPAEPLVAASIPGGAESFTFYMPVNQRGVVAASTSSKTKPSHAPSYSTYIKITALDASGQAYTYKIYPGANVVNDYNISSNNRYSISLTVNASGDSSTDDRVESYDQLDFESANSFIVNPSPMGSTPRFFTIPIDKVNQFWQGVDNTLLIGPTEAWIVELIWQDTPTPNCIGFIDLNDPNARPTNVFNGTGPDHRIALIAKSGSEGNALIGLKKVGRESVGYLWSWHLWVTSYDPKYEVVPVENQYVYSVPGGAVHRYKGDMWTLPEGKCYTRYIMDRNLGARHAGYSTIGALFYQFGRKDPLSSIGYGNVLYDINGIALEASDIRNATTMNKNAGLGVTMATGVLNPTYFYYRDQANVFGDWTNESRAGTHMWNNPVAGVELKSMFDPCPHGWKVPMNGIFSDFAYNEHLPAFSTVLNVTRDERLGWSHNGIVGGRYWPRGFPILGTIYFPTLGCRYISDGTNALHSTHVYYWLSSTDDFSWAYYFGMTSSGVEFGGAVKSHGFSVRCVQE